MKIKSLNWVHQHDPRTGKSVLVLFTNSEFAFLFNVAKPDGPFLEYDVPAIYESENLKTDFPFIKSGIGLLKSNPTVLANELLLWHIRSAREPELMFPARMPL